MKNDRLNIGVCNDTSILNGHLFGKISYQSNRQEGRNDNTKAIKSGRPFKRLGWGLWLFINQQKDFEVMYDAIHSVMRLRSCDILATDWEAKND